jgi:hypothetical protein
VAVKGGRVELCLRISLQDEQEFEFVKGKAFIVFSGRIEAIAPRSKMIVLFLLMFNITSNLMVEKASGEIGRLGSQSYHFINGIIRFLYHFIGTDSADGMRD